MCLPVKYCTSRSRSLRQALGIPFSEKPGVNVPPATKPGKKSRARKRAPQALAALTPIARVERTLLLFFFQTERCWASAMNFFDLGGSAGDLRFTRHMRAHLLKASKHAQMLLGALANVSTVAEDAGSGVSITPLTKAQVAAQFHWITGYYHFHMRHWGQALEHLPLCREYYIGLLQTPIDESVRHLFVSRLEDIDAMLQRCFFRLQILPPSNDRAAAQADYAKRLAEMVAASDQPTYFLTPDEISTAGTVAEAAARARSAGAHGLSKKRRLLEQTGLPEELLPVLPCAKRAKARQSAIQAACDAVASGGQLEHVPTSAALGLAEVPLIFFDMVPGYLALGGIDPAQTVDKVAGRPTGGNLPVVPAAAVPPSAAPVATSAHAPMEVVRSEEEDDDDFVDAEEGSDW
ncbi:hypothetical protein H696_01444 [Fonticula alba]|uniref:Signal recognition particle subunit SRP68 n=1 Tax=Fonticula alba TaxID=691883 RepID=A0A058ZDN4_FONAL|nr:hypothetical protein H696_01444 [Fonticula alba]KCV72038.1 hypothetical protein H696_01444 [Fonticula alba]|eukprot:XP_009493616.1 hypothetical protein H696_01444 [Fonticula alba]